MNEHATTPIAYILTMVGIVIGFLQAVMIMLLLGLKGDINDLWDRVYNHYHEIECPSADCTAVKTGNVVVPHGGR